MQYSYTVQYQTIHLRVLYENEIFFTSMCVCCVLLVHSTCLISEGQRWIMDAATVGRPPGFHKRGTAAPRHLRNIKFKNLLK